MSRRTPLTSQTRKVCLVIRKNKKIPLSKIEEYCKNEFERYAFIEHENHIDVKTGEIEGVHYHIVGDMIGSKIALSTRLNTICKYFGFDNQNGLEIEQYRTFEGALQYLTHKNQPEKTQVDVSMIHHNLTKEDFEIFYNADIGNVITFDLLYASCISANNIVDVIKDLGIGNYRTWRQVVWDIWNTLNEKDDFIRK